MDPTQPSTSKQYFESLNDQKTKDVSMRTETNEDKMLDELVGAEEFLTKKGLPMIEYEKQMFIDMAYNDGLLVCAKGISYDRVLINLLRAYCDTGNLILIINCADYEEKYFKNNLEAKFIHESSSNTTEREKVYLEGGIQFISTRILVVDLLKSRIPIELITGVIILRAHKIIESCQEAFALRLYRQKNKTGFIKGFSNSPESFTYGYGHVEKVMRNLFLKELFIWPRFHAVIKKQLKTCEPQVIELHIPMTPKMLSIQSHILDLMNFLVKEIKRINRTIDLQEVTVENCITQRFHKILQAQLDSIWHQLSAQTKLLISDLKILRSLMISTIYNDSVSLYALMKKYRTKTYAMNNSGWVLLDAAEQMFKICKNRVFNEHEEFDPEPAPKWKIVSEILRNEIPSDVKKTIKSKAITEPDEQIKVLILCHDARTCYQLSQYLTQGAEKYLFFNAMKNDIPVQKLSENYKSIKETESVISIQNIETYLSKSNKKMNPVVDEIEQKNLSSLEKPSTSGKSDTTMKLKRTSEVIEDCVAIEQDADNVKNVEEDELNRITNDDEYDCSFFFRDSYVLTLTQNSQITSNNKNDDERDENFNATQLETGQFETISELENMDITTITNAFSAPIICLQTFKSGEDGSLSLERTLNEMKPNYIIMYHSNVIAIRQIEVHEARLQRKMSQRLKVYFIIHSETVEEQSYLTSLRREKQAFDLLIETKRTMVIPEYQDGKSDENLLMLEKNSDEIDTRSAGGQAIPIKITPRVIVDMREFRSELPCLIHRRGIEVVPVTITVGDYILTPDICVERKSISDLIGSLNSGRLYNQCVQMTRYYAKPVLLIEFDQNKPFHLQSHYMVSGEKTSNVDITQKLQLLTIYFPKLRLVWSPSPYATAQLFEELKFEKPEPDPIKSMAIGSDDCKDLEKISDRINTNVHDFLLKLPGINSRNIGKLMRKVKNLKELLKYNVQELTDILGSNSNARMLWEILHVTHKPVTADANEKQFMSKFKRGKYKRF